MAANRVKPGSNRHADPAVTEDRLRQQLASYAPGLEAEVVLLRQLQAVSLAQRAALDARDPEQISAITRERDRIMAALVTIEHDLRPIRAELAANRGAVAGLDHFGDVSALHRLASDLVATIIHADHDTLAALQEAEVARRFAADTLQVAGSTLAAYRRVVSPPIPAAGLVDRRG